jgi:ABC-type polysaccharide/polyol phosphate transport system ATPase subunit
MITRSGVQLFRCSGVQEGGRSGVRAFGRSGGTVSPPRATSNQDSPFFTGSQGPTASSLPLIEARGLVKEFVVAHHHGSLKRLMLSFGRTRRDRHRALDGIDLSVWAGETLALVGRNGSGKSTLLSLIGRIYRKTAGELVVRGRVSPLLELGAGFVWDLTGLENISLNGAILGIPRKRLNQIVDQIVEFAELQEAIDTPIRTYSSGMLMRLGFSIAVHAESEILLVDEVLAVGDEAFQEKCYAKIEQFQRMGRTILFVSHDMDAVRRVAPRTVWLHNGVLRQDGPTDEVVPHYLAAMHERS